MADPAVGQYIGGAAHIGAPNVGAWAVRVHARRDVQSCEDAGSGGRD